VRPVVASTLLLAAAGPALLAVAPSRPPRPPVTAGAGAVIGIGAGATLFAALARRLPRHAPVPLVAIVAAVGVSEEMIWRGFALARLVVPVGVAGAVAITSVAFALTHVPALRSRGAAVHLLTGTAFGSLFVATGSLLACALAHASYNALAVLARATPASAISLSGVEKRFGANVALRSIDLVIERGELVALLGPNGAGKTTLASLVVGLRRPSAGIVRVLGRDPRDWRARARLGATPQEMGFPPTLRVREILTLGRAHAPSAPPVGEAATRFGLEGIVRRQAGALSGGQRRRLALALAFVAAPDVVVLDEPTTGLDVAARRQAWSAITRFASAGGAALLTTHSIDEACALATRVVVLAHGSVVAERDAISEDELLRLTT